MIFSSRSVASVYFPAEASSSASFAPADTHGPIVYQQLWHLLAIEPIHEQENKVAQAQLDGLCRVDGYSVFPRCHREPPVSFGFWIMPSLTGKSSFNNVDVL